MHLQSQHVGCEELSTIVSSLGSTEINDFELDACLRYISHVTLQNPSMDNNLKSVNAIPCAEFYDKLSAAMELSIHCRARKFRAHSNKYHTISKISVFEDRL